MLLGALQVEMVRWPTLHTGARAGHHRWSGFHRGCLVSPQDGSEETHEGDTIVASSRRIAWSVRLQLGNAMVEQEGWTWTQSIDETTNDACTIGWRRMDSTTAVCIRSQHMDARAAEAFLT